MKMPTCPYIIFMILFFVSCSGKNDRIAENEFSDNEFDIESSDFDDFDNEFSDSDIYKCKNDSGCMENEVCDPYGDCLCDVDKGYFFKYEGKCITYFEVNRLFCNGHAVMIDVNPEILKGHTAFIENGMEKNVCCSTCLLGYVGRFCEEKIEGYNDSVMELDEKENKTGFLMPEPYCVESSECAEGLSCVDGYCECEGNIEFKDSDMASLISMHLGLAETRTVFSGKELLKIKDFQLVLYKDSTDIHGLRCLSNIRVLAIPGMGDSQDLTELTYLKKVQHLAVLANSDFSWLAKMENLLSLDLMTNGFNDFSFLKESKYKEFLTDLELNLYCGADSCDNLDMSPIKKLKNLQEISITTQSGNIPEIDLSMLSDMKHLKNLYIRVGTGGVFESKIKNISVLNNLSELVGFGTYSTGYSLSDLNRNEKINFLVVDDSVITENISNLFPNLIYLSYIDLGEKNDSSVLSGLNKLLKLNITNSIKGLKYPGLEDRLSEMEHLRTLWIEPFEGRSNLNFLEKMKYIEQIQLLTELPEEEERDINVTKNLLYLRIFEDITGGSVTFSPFVENCNNGGAFCRDDANRYISGIKMESGENYRRIYFNSPLFNPENESENIKFLKENGIIVEYDY